MQVVVEINAVVNETDTHLYGCQIVDMDEDVVWLLADPNDLYTKYTYVEEYDSYEFWGQKGASKIREVEVIACMLAGHKVLNAQDVIEQIMENEYE